MSLVDFYKLSLNEFAAFLQQVQTGAIMHAADPYAFPAEDRAQLEQDVTAWKEALIQVDLLDEGCDEAKQTRDDARKTFRKVVRPAREWAKGQFHGDDERRGEYKLQDAPPTRLVDLLAYGRSLLEANTQEPPLDPALPERLLVPIQSVFAELEAGVEAYQSGRLAYKQVLTGRNALRDEIEARVRGLRQYLYSYLDREDPILRDYGLAR